MKAGLALIVNSLKRVRFLVLTLGVLLCGFQVLLSLVAASIQRSRGFDDLYSLVPDFFRQLMGPAFTALMSYSGIVCVGYFHIAVMGSLVGLVIALATEPAAEIEKGFMDLVLSRPLARGWVIMRSLAVVLISTILVLALMMLGTWIGQRWLSPEGAVGPSAHLIRSLAVNLGVLILCWAGVAILISSFSRRRAVAGALTGLLALTTFLLDYVARAWSPAEKVAWLSPFRYYNPLDIVTGLPVHTRNLWILGSATVIGFALALVQFSRRDI